MGRTSSITMPSMMGILGRAPALDKTKKCDVCYVTGRPARSAAMPVLLLLTGPKMGFSPRRGDTLPR